MNARIMGADALHLASAVLLNGFLKNTNDQLIFIGSDTELNAAAADQGFAVIDPGATER